MATKSKKGLVGSRGGTLPDITMKVSRETHRKIVIFAARRGCRLPEAIAIKFSDVS